MTVFVSASGIRIDSRTPLPASFRLDDIAEGISNIARFGGGTHPAPYSVAQHCSIVGDEMDRRAGPLAGLYGLLHDGHEYLIGDILYPLETGLSRGAQDEIAAQRDRLDASIHARFDLDWPPDAATMRLFHAVHDAVVLTEMRDLTRGREPEIAAFEARGVKRLPARIRPRAFPLTREAWLKRFHAMAAAAGLRISEGARA